MIKKNSELTDLQKFKKTVQIQENKLEKLAKLCILCRLVLEDHYTLFYKQPVYKQRGLNSEFFKQLSPQISWK